ncbi:MAG: type II toxin-antitoxin system VapC family toxin [Chloroflexi bacterium]|nr:type II toxin-antitoxin system VapC family toxin [Chloroflexota bacterium]
MTEVVRCLDTNIWIRYLVGEEPPELAAAARRLVWDATPSGRLVAPAWAWAEVGSVLRKKVRQGQIEWGEAETLWARFGQLPIEFIDTPAVRNRAWEIAGQFGLPTLYDATFLACTEMAPASEPAVREFWTADDELLRRLGARRPAYVRRLGEQSAAF